MSSQRIVAGVLVSMLVVSLVSSACFGSDPNSAGASENAQAAPGERSPLSTGLVALGAALAVGLCALATGIAQSRIGAAGCGTLAEKPETGGTIILLVAIPETMVILGFVVAIVLLLTL